MHLKRWLTGVIALPVLIYLVGFGPRWLLYGFLAAAAVGGLLEFVRMTAPGMPGAMRALCAVPAVLLFWTASRGTFFLMPAVFSRYPAGNVWIFFLLAVVFASDTGAFYFGRFFGKHRLHPAVSPGKTWEGAVGGLLCALIPVYVFQAFFHAGKVTVFFLALALAVVGQVGDLSESLLKRACGVKDSGGILPGHGGILDRIDGLIFAIPVLYAYLAWTSG